MEEREDKTMFSFRLIDMPDGSQIIDTTLKTPYSALNPVQMVEYAEVDNNLAYMRRFERQKRREADRQRKLARNPLWKLAYMCGIVY